MNPTAFIAHCQTLLGTQYVLLEESDQSPYLRDWRNRYQGKALAILLPQTTEQVAEIVKACNQAKISLVPQGGKHQYVWRRHSQRFWAAGGHKPQAHADHTRD